MSTDLQCVEKTSEKQQRMLRSHKIRSKITPCVNYFVKNWIGTEAKNNIVYEIDCNNYKTTKDLSRIAIVNRMKLQNTVGKQITTLTWI